MGCPLPLALVLIAERFGGFPWEVERADAERVQYYLNVIGIEGEAHEAMDDLKPDEKLVKYWGDDGTKRT